MVPRAPCAVPINYCLENLSIHYASLSTRFKPLHSSTNQELLKSISVVKVATKKNMHDFHYAKEAIMVSPN